MTTIDRHIKTITETVLRRLEEETTAAVKAIPGEIPVASLSERAQLAIREYKRAAHFKAQAEQRLKRFGIEPYQALKAQTRIANHRREDRQVAIRQSAQQRKELIKALRTKAFLDVMGQPPATQAEILRKLVKDLEKV